MIKIKFKKNKKEVSVSESKVRIEVFRELGTTPYSIAKFEALQHKEPNNNLVLIESSNNFKEEVDIIQHKLIQDLHERLEFHKKDNKERIEIVKNKITGQQEFIASIRDGYYHKKEKDDIDKEIIKKIKVNRLDEDCKLREYRALLDILVNSGEGSHETIDSDGLKRIFYLYKEGILVPYKFIKNKTTLYPDISTRRKQYKENQDAIDVNFLHDNKGFFSGWKKYVGIAIILIMLIGNIYWSINLNQAYSNFDEKKADEYSTKCAYWCVNMINETETFITTYDNMISEKEKSDDKDKISIG